MKLKKTIKNILAIRHEETKEDLIKRGVKMGNNVNIYSCNIDQGHGFLVEIGDNVTITHSVILTHDASTKNALGYSKVGKVKIGNNVFIGYGSIILPGVQIGNDVIIGAGTVVRENIPDNSVAIGNPAQIACNTNEYLEKNRKRMKHVPVYETYWKDKTEKEKKQMVEELDETIGFDV